MSKEELLKRFKEISDEMGRMIIDRSRLQEVAAALEAEIQPYIDEMDALEHDQKAQDAYIQNAPEHVRQSIDVLNITEEAIDHLDALARDFESLQEFAKKQYSAIEEHRGQVRLNRSLPN